jgi:phenylacetate-CoA ligase
MTKLYGRSDNMVKLRGVNVFPEAIGALVAQDARSNGEYVCLLDRLDGRDEMTVLVEMLDDSAPKDRVSAELAERFKEALSVKVKVEAVSRGKLDQMTGLTQTSKIKRLIDRRPALAHSSS